MSDYGNEKILIAYFFLSFNDPEKEASHGGVHLTFSTHPHQPYLRAGGETLSCYFRLLVQNL